MRRTIINGGNLTLCKNTINVPSVCRTCRLFEVLAPLFTTVYGIIIFLHVSRHPLQQSVAAPCNPRLFLNLVYPTWAKLVPLFTSLVPSIIFHPKLKHFRMTSQTSNADNKQRTNNQPGTTTIQNCIVFMIRKVHLSFTKMNGCRSSMQMRATAQTLTPAERCANIDRAAIGIP